jgi:hypothetical protein
VLFSYVHIKTRPVKGNVAPNGRRHRAVRYDGSIATLSTPVSTVDPSANVIFLKALSDKQAKVVLMGKRPVWERHLANAIASVAVGVAIGMTGLLFPAPAQHMQQIQQMPEHVHWVPLPTSPFLEVARTPEGGYSLERALLAYNAAGLSSQQATEIVSRLQEFSPVLMGVADKDLEARFIEQAHATINELSKAYPQQEAVLAKMVGSEKISSSSKDAKDLAHPGWLTPRAMWLLDGTPANDLVETGSLSDMSMEEARGALKDAVAETGLRAFRTMPSQWSSPEVLFTMAKSLEEANNDLMDATGWEGQVLGLGGRVVLKMGRPPARFGAAGLAQAMVNGEVHIQAEWNNLAHEWVHGVEYFSAQKAYRNPTLATLTQQSGGAVSDQETINTFHQAYASLKELAPQWQSAREERSHAITQEHRHQSTDILSFAGADNVVHEATYWVSPTEGMAFSFQAYVGSLNPVVLGTEFSGREAYRLPVSDEVQSQSKVWPAFFASLEKLKLTTPYQVQPRAAPKDASGFVDRLLNRQMQSSTQQARTPKSP